MNVSHSISLFKRYLNYDGFGKKYLFPFMIAALAFCINIYNYDYPPVQDGLTAMFFIDYMNGIEMRIMMLPYHSNNFMLFPFLFIFGPEITSIRIAQSFAIALSVLLVYLFVKRIHDERHAFISSLLLSVMPFFVLERWGETPFIPLYGLSVLILLYEYYKTSKSKYLFSASFIAGAAIFFKLTIIYLLFSLFFALILVNFIYKLSLLKRIKCSHVVLCTALLMLGATPLIYYNVTGGWPTLNYIEENLIQTHNIHNNALLLQNLNQRLNHLMIISSENPYSAPKTYGFFDKEPRVSVLNFPLLFFCVPLLVFYRRPKDLFLVLMLFIFLFLSIFSLNFMRPEHIFLLLPIIAIIITRGINIMSERRRFLGVLIIIVFLVVNGFFVADAATKAKVRMDYYESKYLYEAATLCRNASNVVFVKRNCTTNLDDFHFGSWGKEYKCYAAGGWIPGERPNYKHIEEFDFDEELANSDKRTLFIFESTVLSKFGDINDSLNSLVDNNLISLDGKVNRFNDIMFLIYEINR